MDYIKDTFTRMDLLQIRAFLLYGAEDIEESPKSYKERLKNESDPIYSRLHSLYPNEEDLDKAAADLAKALTAYEAVYFEIGMKAGARLIFQLLHSDEQISEELSRITK